MSSPEELIRAVFGRQVGKTSGVRIYAGASDEIVVAASAFLEMLFRVATTLAGDARYVDESHLRAAYADLILKRLIRKNG